MSRVQKKLYVWTWTLAILGLVSFASVAPAQHLFRTLPDMLDRDWVSSRIEPATFLSGLSAHDSPRDRYVKIRDHLHGLGLHPLLNLVARPSDFELSSAAEIGSNSGLHVREYVLKVGAYEVCKTTIRTVDAPSGASHILGVVPVVDAVYPHADDSWMSSSEAIDMASSSLQKATQSSGPYAVASMARCLYPVSGELVPAWKMVMRAERLPYQIYIGPNGVIEGDAMMFDATAPVRAYQSNSKDPDPKKMTLIDFNVDVGSDGYLTNDYFTTGFGNKATRKQAPFNAAPSDPDHFNEQSSFAHVNRQFQFVSQNGYNWKGPKPLKVMTSYTIAVGRESNAQYVPFDGESGPYIVIGPGKTGELTNLATDSDVVSHEFGHHVVYSSVTDIPSGSESLVIHEGMADALAFAASGDNCLAESICPNPDAKSYCQVLGRCLRTADNSLKYHDSVYQAIPGAHARGQLISGFFADLRKGGLIPTDNLNKLIVGTVSYLPREANVKALVTAVRDADFALFAQQYANVIESAAAARSMGVNDLGINLAEIDGQPPSEGSVKKKSSGDGFLGLCSIGSGSANNASVIALMTILMVPFLAMYLRRPKPVAVKIRKIGNKRQ